MNYFPGLDYLIRLSTDAPSLDPVIIDCAGFDESEIIDAVERILVNIDYRLSRVGAINPKVAVVMPAKFDKLMCRIKLFYTSTRIVVDRKLPVDTIFVLTKRFNGTDIIKPADNITWDEYFKRIAKGEKLRLSVLAPWAQGKLFNIGASNDYQRNL